MQPLEKLINEEFKAKLARTLERLTLLSHNLLSSRSKVYPL